MEEDEYKSIYSEMASVRCFFEKALTNKQAKCQLSKHFCLADREGYSCMDAESSIICSEFLEKLRKSSMFVFKVRDIDGPLPHNMEIRAQAGGIKGLLRLLDSQSENQSAPAGSDDISGILSRAFKKYGSLDKLPYSEIVQSVKQFQGRRRRKS